MSEEGRDVRRKQEGKIGEELKRQGGKKDQTLERKEEVSMNEEEVKRV